MKTALKGILSLGLFFYGTLAEAKTCAEALRKKYASDVLFSLLSIPADISFFYDEPYELTKLRRVKRLYQLLVAAEEYSTKKGHNTITKFYSKIVDKEPLIIFSIDEVVTLLNQLNTEPMLRKTCLSWGYDIREVFRNNSTVASFQTKLTKLHEASLIRQEYQKNKLNLKNETVTSDNPDESMWKVDEFYCEFEE